VLKVAYATSDGFVVDGHFGSGERFDVYQVTSSGAVLLGSRTPAADATDRIASRVDLLRDCAILQVVSIGGPAAARVTRAGIHPLRVEADSPIEALNFRLRRVLAGNPPPWLRRLTREQLPAAGGAA
jgi:nitrogen fixation protein NifX